MPATNRTERLADRERNSKWRPAPFRIEMSECINCDACLRHCPPQFGAIFNHGIDVIIIPELCSGCGEVPRPLPGRLHLRGPGVDARLRGLVECARHRRSVHQPAAPCTRRVL